MDLLQLKTELETDPSGLGYAGPWAAGDNGTLTAILNEIRPGITVEIAEADPQSVQACVVASEYAAISDVQRRAWGCIVGLPTIPVKNAAIRAQILAIWAAGTATRANLAALQTRPGSRAEQLFGAGTVVSHQDIAKSRSL